MSFWEKWMDTWDWTEDRAPSAFFMALGMTVAQVVLSLVCMSVPLVGMGLAAFWAPVALTWGIPTYFSLRRRGRSGAASGLLLALVILNLLYGACWGVIMSGKVRLAG